MLRNETETLKSEISNEVFEQLYIGLRAKEQRIYSDEQLLQLPEIEPVHIHFQEWNIRKCSSERLTTYLTKKLRPLNILEIGCGNGWLASKLANIKCVNVIAIDINQVEIDQAKRVFKKGNLEFRHCNFDPESFTGIKFDVVVFAAALQYFSPLKNMLEKVQQCLATGGEIHILDTNFYSLTNIIGAIKRTKNYFKEQGYPEMASCYFHHLLSDLQDFNYKVLSNPNHILNRLLKTGPFYWICIYRS